MDTKNSETQSFWDRLKQKFQVDIRDPETFDIIRSFKYSKFKLYAIIFCVFLFGFMLSIGIVWYTPAKKLVPGFADPMQNNAYVALVDKISKLENDLKNQESYTSSFKKILTKDVDSASTNPINTTEDTQTESELPADNPETEALLKEMELAHTLSELRTNIKVSEQLQGLNKIDQLYFIPPVIGVVSEGFKADEKHYGVDLLAPKNSPIKSILDGVVIAADWTLETGNTIVVQHDYQLISIYKHNSMLLKKVGQNVQAGEAIAIIGNTGTLSDGPHLHFELWIKGHPINPADYISFE